MDYSKEYLLEVLKKFNRLDSLGDQWEFVKEAAIEEQEKLLLQFLKRQLAGDIALSRIEAIQWLLDFIVKIQKQGELAKEKLTK